MATPPPARDSEKTNNQPQSDLEMPSKDRDDVQVYAGYVEEEKHDRSIQIIYFKIILPLYFITIWIGMFMLTEGLYETTFKWLTTIIITVFLFAFQAKIKTILAKMLLH